MKNEKSKNEYNIAKMKERNKNDSCSSEETKNICNYNKVVTTEDGICSKKCRFWIDFPEDNNCIFVSIEKHGNLTLREVSKRLGISYVRVQQIEGKAEQELLLALKREKEKAHQVRKRILNE